MIYSSVIGRSSMPFQFFLGGRGIGKTYSALEDVAREGSPCTMWARRYAEEMAEICESGLFVNLQQNGKALDMHAEMAKKGTVGKIYRGDDPVGYCTGISNFAKKRGIDYPDVERIIVDEISPEEHRPFFRGEGKALFNMYESINRNREFDGRPPVQMICLSNCIKLSTPAFLQIPGFIEALQQMIARHEYRRTLKDQCCYIEIMDNKVFAQAKSQTALYRLLGTKSEITRSNINNEFVKDDFSVVRSRKSVNINEYVPLIKYLDLSIFRHKSSGEFYVSDEDSSAPLKLVESQRELLKRHFGIDFRCAVAARKIKFASYDLYILMCSILDYKL